MKNIFICLLTIFCLGLNAQQIYLGYPIGEKTITCGDKIIVNIPTHKDGRFLPNQGIEQLIMLLNSSSRFVYHIEIYDFLSSGINASAYTDFICNNLQNYLESKCLYDNYHLYSCGDALAIFCFKDSKINNLMNTRMEIQIECYTTY